MKSNNIEKNTEESKIDEVLKHSTINNPEQTFCEQTTYLEYLLQNAETEEEKEQIKESINNYLEIYDTEETNKEDENK